MKKSLFESIQNNLNEDVNFEKLSPNDLMEYYIDCCEINGISIEEAIKTLFDYKCINVRNFKTMVKEFES